MNACVHLYSLITATSPGTTEVPDGAMYTIVFDCGTPLLQHNNNSCILLLLYYSYCYWSNQHILQWLYRHTTVRISK